MPQFISAFKPFNKGAFEILSMLVTYTVDSCFWIGTHLGYEGSALVKEFGGDEVTVGRSSLPHELPRRVP